MRMKGIAAAVLCACLIGCGGDDGPTAPNAQNGDFAVTVSSGTTPQYSWSGGGAFSVSVVRTAAPGTIVWGVADPINKNLPSPVTHGNRGAGVESATTEKVLTAGVEYRVSVTMANGKTGWKSFKP